MSAEEPRGGPQPAPGCAVRRRCRRWQRNVDVNENQAQQAGGHDAAAGEELAPLLFDRILVHVAIIGRSYSDLTPSR